ncbi:MAG: sulfatase-like hydrolase/transferase, partial [Verrucomicrobia bacterium]|nr:sulfatase-like hydrolase/transferase [Verrucomicrobiota bacterium]
MSLIRTGWFRRRLALAAFLVSALAAAAAESRRPNIVILLADDQGWGDLSATGNKQVSTPAIDSLAR